MTNMHNHTLPFGEGRGGAPGTGRLRLDIDIHTHAGAPRHDAVLCVDPVTTDELPDGDGLLSVGIHPWHADGATPEVWQRLERWLDDPRVVALSEAGLDALRGPDVESVQLPVFERQARMAAERNLPLVIHSVRTNHHLLRLRRNPVYTNQWILHGFRGGETAARQLLDAGIDLSFGHRYNPAAYAATPPLRRYHETD